MRTTYDGYEIAERDLALRGPGDFLRVSEQDAIRQSGGLRFRLAELCDDTGLLAAAFREARELLNTDPTLQEHPLLRHTVEQMFATDRDILS